MKKKIFIITLITFVIDQIIKSLSLVYLINIPIIPNILSLTYAKNYGIAFSMLREKRIIIIAISILLISFLIYVLKKDYISKNKDTWLVNIAFGILFGGILGNLFDRIVRGFVIDYINVSFFSIFNLADIAITFGVVLLIIFLLFSYCSTYYKYNNINNYNFK